MEFQAHGTSDYTSIQSIFLLFPCCIDAIHFNGLNITKENNKTYEWISEK